MRETLVTRRIRLISKRACKHLSQKCGLKLSLRIVVTVETVSQIVDDDWFSVRKNLLHVRTLLVSTWKYEIEIKIEFSLRCLFCLLVESTEEIGASARIAHAWRMLSNSEPYFTSTFSRLIEVRNRDWRRGKMNMVWNVFTTWFFSEVILDATIPYLYQIVRR